MNANGEYPLVAPRCVPFIRTYRATVLSRVTSLTEYDAPVVVVYTDVHVVRVPSKIRAEPNAPTICEPRSPDSASLTSVQKRVAILLPCLGAFICGACLTSTNVPVAGSGGPSEPGAPQGDDSGVPSVPNAVPDATQGGNGGFPSGPDATQGEGGSSVIDATWPNPDGFPETDSIVSMDGASSKDGAIHDGATAEVGDGAGKAPFKGIAGSNCSELVSLDLAWWYDWELGPTGCTSTPFVPMVWGAGTATAIATSVSAGVTAGYKYVLGFNEPDNASQSNISVATAISLWLSFNNPSVLIGSPATQGNATGLAWIQDFMTQVNADTTGKLRVDFIATHWYGWDAGACDAAANGLQSWIEGIEAIPGNRPIWLTEWGCLNASNPNAATVQAFYAGASAMFAKHPRVVRYAWYQWSPYNEVIDADSGALTPLGTAYANAPAYH